MCGILFSLRYDEPVNRTYFEKALDLIKHRGPDGEGTEYISEDKYKLGLGHRRLAIFDLSAAGTQPQSKHDLTIIFNGEIFNWPELRAELEKSGYKFSSNCDTEIILSAYHEWGPECVKKFNGFWAFIIYSHRENDRHIFVSRDRLGIKPLYYSEYDNGYDFSSEVKSLFQINNTKPKINYESLSRYLILGLSHDNDKTIYENVFEFEPGQNFILNLENRDTKSWKYWDLSEVPEHREASDEDILDEFEYLIEDSVRLRFRSDREVGITLSGGIDSSIVALAAKRNRIENITAFTTKYDNHKEYDETYFAKKVAEKLDIRHLLIEPESFDLRDNEQKLTWHQELLYVSFSMLANWSIVRSIKESGTIVYLTGQGGDELFLGYERYYAAYFKHILKRSPIKALREFACASNNSKLSPLSLMSYLVYFGTNNIRNKYYKKIARDNYSEKLLNSLKDPVPNVISSNLRNLQDAEVCGQQLRRLLRYDDRISSAFGLESRPVFLDFRLVEFAYSLGYSHKINKGWTKYLLRRYLDRHGLPEIAWRKHKLGFAAPTGAWTDELVKFYGEPQIKSRIAPLLKENIRLEKLDKKDLFKIYNLYSTAINLDWELN